MDINDPVTLEQLPTFSLSIKDCFVKKKEALGRVLLEKKNLFRLVWLINFFNQPPTRLKRLKKHLCDYIAIVAHVRAISTSYRVFY